MLTLDLPAEPYWLDLPRGVRVEIRPVTTAVMAAAQAGSAPRLGALRAAEADLDPDMARGLAFSFLVKALARHAVVAWEGVGDTAGKPLPLSPEAVERLMNMEKTAAALSLRSSLGARLRLYLGANRRRARASSDPTKAICARLNAIPAHQAAA